MQSPHITKNHTTARKIQQFALACLYFATNGEEWEKRNNWLSYDESECAWLSDAPSGLVCSGSNEYNILSLNQVTLNGSLPEEFWLLSSLISIAFYDHKDLRGHIPSRIAKMPALESLALIDLGLDGSLPKQIGSTQLKSIHLGGNALTSTLPQELGDIESLRYLMLNDNFLSGPLPAQLWTLTNLEELVLHGNNLTGTVSSELGNLTNLKGLILQSNAFSGALPSLSTLTDLEYAFLGSNHLSGTLPSHPLSSWGSLLLLDIGNNNFSGPIPSEVGKLYSLEVIDMFNNSFSGSVPSELGLLSNAQKVMLEMNSLEGSMPSELGLLTNLQRLWLHDNDLTGAVPVELCTLAKERSLDLSIDCAKVSCDCQCNCEKSTPQQEKVDGGVEPSKTEENNSIWDNFVNLFSDLF